MKALALVMAGAAIIATGASAQQPGQQQQDQQAQAPGHQATFVGRAGELLGTAQLFETPNGVLVALDVGGLPTGAHAFHIHETGRCDAADGFKTAGGHFAPATNQHGYEVAGGPHAGDMPNQFVPRGGRLVAQVFNPNVRLSGGDNALFDSDGSALIIHSGHDDYSSQPSGDAGDRIACAAIMPTGR